MTVLIIFLLLLFLALMLRRWLVMILLLVAICFWAVAQTPRIENGQMTHIGGQ